MNTQISNYKGSLMTAGMVAAEIGARYGQEEIQNYDPRANCLTYVKWQEQGYQVKKGEKAIKSVTFIEKKDEAGEVIKKYPRSVNLFYIKQVEKITQ